MTRLVKNAARCLRCGDFIESKHRYDYRQCSCGDVFVDGGLSYQRIGFVDAGTFESLAEFVADEELCFDDAAENACAE